jgi:hypothetical protein
LASGVAIWVNINYSVNMPISEIRKYLDNLKIRADSPVAREIDLTKVPNAAAPESMLPTELNWKDKRKGLAAKRHWLFEQFEAAPNNVRMGQEIKQLDDQIAECTEQMRLKQ